MFRCLIINPPLANHSHGTGKQLQYFVESSGMECHHLCWDAGTALGDEPCPFTNLFYNHVKQWPIKRGSGFVDRLQRRSGFIWANGGNLSANSARKVRQLRSRHFDGAYVIVASESEAALARQCLDLLGVPYIINWMDLDPQGSAEISAETHPHISALCRDAYDVFALTKELARSIGHCAQRDISIIRIGRPVAKTLASAPAPGQPLRCVMIGMLNYPSLKVLWPDVFARVRQQGVEVDFYYIGRKHMFNLLPKDMPVTYLGSMFDYKDLDAKLAEMHIGLLPGPDGVPPSDNLARYSFPSRTADYLFHGLPVVGNLHQNSGTAEELKSLLGSAVWLSQSATTLAEALLLLAKDRNRWCAASTAGAAYAHANFDIKSIVGELTESLKSASGCENRNFPMSRANAGSA